MSFIPLNVKDKKNLLRVQKQADKANGYVFGAGEEKNVLSLLACAAGIDYEDETLRFLNNKNQTPENKIISMRNIINNNNKSILKVHT